MIRDKFEMATSKRRGAVWEGHLSKESSWFGRYGYGEIFLSLYKHQNKHQTYKRQTSNNNKHLMDINGH